MHDDVTLHVKIMRAMPVVSKAVCLPKPELLEQL